VHPLCLIIGILSGTTGGALLLAGFVTLHAPDQHDLAQLRERYAIARQKGRLAEYREIMRVRAEYSSALRFFLRWPDHPAARRLIYVGFGLVALGVLVGSLASRWPETAQPHNQPMQRSAR